MLRPAFVSDEVKMTSTDSALKGCYVSIPSGGGRICLPSLNAADFSQFSLSLLEGTGNISLSFRFVACLDTFLVITKCLG